jgi:tagatose 6-phosphate kinase
MARPPGLSEPGAVISDGEWSALADRVTHLARQARGALLAGSVPRAVPDECYAQLVRAASTTGIPVLLDAGR